MSNSVLKYLTGYLIRFVLGTGLVLCLISAIRITRYPEQLQQYKNSGRSKHNPAEKLMQYPDKLVRSIFTPPPAQSPSNKTTSKQPACLSPRNSTAQTIAATQTRHEPNSRQTHETITQAIDQPVKNTPQETNAPKLTHQSSREHPPAASAPVSPPVQPPTPAPRVAMPATGEWGVTANDNTPVYTLKGKLRTHVKAGKPFGILEHKQTPKGEFMICTPPGKPNVKFVLKPEDTITYKCDYNAISLEQRNLSKLQARLTAAITTRKEQLKQQAENRNPYAAEYHRALADYKKFATKNNALLKEYNSTTGARRMQAADQLRILKDEGIRKRQSFNAIKSKYKKWQQNNAAPDINFDADPKIIKLKQKLEEVEHKLANP